MNKRKKKTKRKMIRKNKNSVLLLALFFSLMGAGELSAAEDVDVKAIVFEHLQDSYEWHIVTIGDHDITIHLPVIVHSKETGWHLFSSSKLEAGYDGLYLAPEGKYTGKVVERNSAGEEVRPLDLSFTKTAAALVINGIVLLLVILPLARWYKKHEHTPPKGFRGAVELLLMDIEDNVIRPCIPNDYKRFSPYLLTVFFFVLISNVMGLIPFLPGGANVTGNISITLFLALCTFLAINLFGTKEYWKDVFWPDVPTWLKVPAPIMPVIEVFGVFTKPFALMIRLFANMMAGHSAIIGLVCLIFITVSMGVAVNMGMSVVAILFAIFMNFLEILVAYIQAYVFTLLSAVFIGMAREKSVAEEAVEKN